MAVQKAPVGARGRNPHVKSRGEAKSSDGAEQQALTQSFFFVAKALTQILILRST